MAEEVVKEDVSKEVSEEQPDVKSILSRLSDTEKAVLLKSIETHSSGKGADRKGKPTMVNFRGDDMQVPKTKQRSSYSGVKEVKHTITTDDNTKRYDITEYQDGTYAVREWDLDPATGEPKRTSKITNKPIPSRKISLGSNVDLIQELAENLTTIATTLASEGD
jgi:hypothetical protein